ncbi:hypothetical protein HMPREF0758_4769 [Serratia odorifera DSM 4582]|uniref:Uncharacterized protein n=1 Tax=Serratia odorifera DSM 4582 TaxID=667129 RepID=D4E9B9_SEROD|nr:hypothetical protein HMPREF0758_4769 [Serratia odorifera DSM 4582]
MSSIRVSKLLPANLGHPYQKENQMRQSQTADNVKESGEHAVGRVAASTVGQICREQT